MKNDSTPEFVCFICGLAATTRIPDGIFKVVITTLILAGFIWAQATNKKKSR
jgi:hypothetical protein